MADVFYGIDRGQTEFDITQDTSSPGLDIEVAYDDAVSLTKEEIIRGLEMIINRILKDDFPV